MKKAIFPVTGMSCASCASSLQTQLQAETGIVSAAVNYANASVLVEYDPLRTQPAQLQKAAQAIGFDLILAAQPEEANAIADDLQQKALLSLRNRMWAAIALCIPLTLVGMVWMHWTAANYVMWALATPVVFYFGRQFFVHAYQQARHRKTNMDTLVALSTGIAYSFSVFNTLDPSFWMSRGLHADVYFEASGVIIAFLLIGKYLEERAKSGTSTAIKKLMGLKPKTVTKLLADGQEVAVPIAEVQLGDHLRVKPGEKIPVDGIVVGGNSFVDESMISGESIAVEKIAGQKVLAGTLNQKGSFEFRAEKVGDATVLAQIIAMVQQAQGSKAPVQKLVDKVASIFVPTVMAIAALSFVSWTIWGGAQGFTHGLLALVTVLVIACPCALGLATPTAIMVGIGRAAEQGMLIQDAEALERAHNITAIILDKTGTITEGKAVVTGLVWARACADQARATQVLYALETRSEHPLARAVTAYLADQAVDAVYLQDFESITGQGAKAIYEGQTWHIGNVALMEASSITIPSDIAAQQSKWEDEAKTVILFANASMVLAIIAITDKVKPSSAAAIDRLKADGIEVYMLTGDNAKTAAAVARQVGIAHFEAQVLPGDKAAFVAQLQAQGKVVAMVGDGINDAQALAQADVSIAMGKGSDIAMEVAKMTIISSDLMKLPQAISLSRKTVRTIRQNLFWAFIYNIIGIPIAAGILFPINGFLLNPMIAGAAMALSSVSVVTNSLLLKWRKL